VTNSYWYDTSTSSWPTYNYTVTSGNNYTLKTSTQLKSTDKIEFEIKNGSKYTLTLREYLMYIVIFKDIPDNCENDDEYFRNIMVLRL